MTETDTAMPHNIKKRGVMTMIVIFLWLIAIIAFPVSIIELADGSIEMGIMYLVFSLGVNAFCIYAVFLNIKAKKTNKTCGRKADCGKPCDGGFRDCKTDVVNLFGKVNPIEDSESDDEESDQDDFEIFEIIDDE